MNKAELINAVAEKTGLSKKDTEAVVSASIEVITASLAEGEKVVAAYEYCNLHGLWKKEL